MTDRKLDKLFNPNTVAVIGATTKEGSVGFELMKNMLTAGFEGIIYPINPKRPSICGVKAYRSIAEVPDTIDLAVIATPAKTVPPLVEECGKAGVSGIVIISAGFMESGKEGHAMCDQILKSARHYGMKIIGPNCLGFLAPRAKLNASFAARMALPGKIAFISQSGALCTAILDWANENNIGFSYFVSIGSMIDVGFHDLIDYFGNDPQTSSILIYMESLSNARKFLSAARAFAKSKPIIVLKVGRSAEGSKAAMSHTGSLTGNDAVFDAAFRRAGIIRAKTIGDLFDSAQTLAMQPRPKGSRLAIVTNAGGPGVIATDSLIERGGRIAELENSTIDSLNKVLPKDWSRSNPVDVLGDAPAERYDAAVQACINDPNVDAVLVILTPQGMTDATAVAKSLVKTENRENKTILASWMGEADVREGRIALKRGSIPVYATPENAVRGFMNMVKYSENLKWLYETPATIPHAFSPSTQASRKLIKSITSKGRYVLTEQEAKQLMAYYDIPVAKSAVAKTREEAAKLAVEIGFPVVMKILSPDILHKTDVGGVKVGINSSKEAMDCFETIMLSAKKHMPKADIHGIFIEEMAKKKHELIIGCKKDPIFGPTIVFGMGGVTVELFKDTSIGLPPLNMALAKHLMEGTKVYKLLEGYRGMEGADIEAIQFLLYKFSYLIIDFPEIKEVDINPLTADRSGIVMLDAKVILDEEVVKSGAKPYSHLVISPYPKDLIAEFKMKSGKEATLRPIRPEDEPLVANFFSDLSPESQRFRFFKVIRDISHELLVRFTQNDYDREIAIVAEVEEAKKKKLAGVVRLIADPYNDSAEFSIVIADMFHNQGLGTKLVDYILQIARTRGIRRVYASFLKDNRIMETMFKNRGFSISEKEGLLHAELALTSGKPKKEKLQKALQASADGKNKKKATA